ncbi:hypothetical protein HRE53_20300 [Acaryochloris sp. 'Moss Beach']|uniref:hypothetical protein n=1 Tax=Acaryochloris TaxID=155977 RepID=UPI001BB0C09A|nr:MULTISPECIES: hypothetical protein [Acaryochloris]QUY44036.1 hypothetical protein I1H34_08035 [Acaryochloris marina S15]UJB68788.1 hypothetical protein HRE53_20300 [Acaryochloris sp. 'Moss Beach']
MSFHALQVTLRKLTQKSRSYPYQCLAAGRKWHQYLWRDLNNQFVLEASPDQSLYYMTTQRDGVKPGDYIEISGLGSSSHYQIIQLERYCDPPDMWMATLRKLTLNFGYSQA